MAPKTGYENNSFVIVGFRSKCDSYPIYASRFKRLIEKLKDNDE